jgi:hypothetical protein
MSGELGFYDVVVGNMGDRNDLNLWYKGGSLVEDVAAVCSNTIVVVHSVGPVYFTWSDHPNITGIIYAGAPGEQAGPAIIDVLWGAYNPRGRLPFSIADVRGFLSFLASYAELFADRTRLHTEQPLFITALAFRKLTIRKSYSWTIGI